MIISVERLIIFLTLFLVMYVPVVASYFGDYHIIIFKFIFPTYLFFMFVWYAKVKTNNFIIFLSYLIITAFIMAFIYDTLFIDILHVVSYLMMFIGVYGFANFICKNELSNINLVFVTILTIFFLSLLTEYFFAFLGFENAAYWDFKIYDAIVYRHGNPTSTLNTFGNIGSGKGITPAYIVLSICSISYLFSKGFVKYILLSFVIFLGVMTYSRAFLLTLVIYGIFEVLNTSFRRKIFYLLITFVTSFCIIFYNYDLINIFIRLDFGAEASTSGKSFNDSPRLALLLMQIEAISDKFIFGHGWSGMNAYFIEKFNRDTSGELGMVSFFVEQGFLRTMYIYLLIGVSLYGTLKFINSKSNLLKEVYIANILILSFNFFWGATLVNNSRTVLMWLFIFLVILIRKNERFYKEYQV